MAMKSTAMNTGLCRASYLNALAPRAAQEGAKPKYSVQLLIPKTDTETVKNIKACIAAAHAADKDGANKLKGIVTPKNPLHDGDGLKPSGEAYDATCQGHWVMSASSDNKPGLVDINGDKMEDADEWYSGIYVRANINFYAYNAAGNKGIACGLNHLQKRRDGEALAGSGSPTAAFNDGYAGDEDSVLD
jgi:hypothetical protein